MTASKIVAAAASGVGGAGLDVDEVFSTFLYDGTGSTRSITNNIDLSTEGGLVWIKSRSSADNNWLFDTERGSGKAVFSNDWQAENTFSTSLSAFNSNGFSLGSIGETNGSGKNLVSWTFRKAPKFFDVVTYTGDGQSSKTISHSLGTTVGMMLVKQLNTDGSWHVFHRLGGSGNGGYLNGTDAFSSTSVFPSAPTSTNFSVAVATNAGLNKNNNTYVAYLFAHNNSDGGFGPDSDQDIIKCGSYTGNNSTTGPVVNLGFEPQWLLIRHTDASGNSSFIVDNMRGVVTGGNDASLSPNATSDEQTISDLLEFNATGFQLKRANDNVNGSGNTYIYMAIRRGPLAAPEDATKVFAIGTYGANRNSSTTDTYYAGFPVDMALRRVPVTSTANTFISSRILGPTDIKTNTSDVEIAGETEAVWDSNTHWNNAAGTSTTSYSWMWKRAPGYFDVVCYKGTNQLGSVVSHNLGVAPEMIWTKLRDTGANDWVVWHSALGNKEFLKLNSTAAKGSNNTGAGWLPTSTTFNADYYMGPGANYADNQIAYLFATVPNVSKCGSYTGNGTSQTIDCGFSSGARFVLVKQSSGTGSWYLFDTARGINAGNDNLLQLNFTSAEYTGADLIDPHSSGFIVVGDNNNMNTNGQTFIFYAIA